MKCVRIFSGLVKKIESLHVLQSSPLLTCTRKASTSTVSISKGVPDDIEDRSVETTFNPDVPIIRKVTNFPTFAPAKQAWLETLSEIENRKLGLLELHPDVFAVFPRIDILWANAHWQLFYKKINYDFAPNRAELSGGGHKPWPQKGTGRARHGSIRSPLFVGGGKSHGPRGPKSYFYMLPFTMRVLGLRVALSVKYAQGDLHIVDSLEMPTNNPEFLKELVESRGWGLSVLFIDDTDIIPKNIAVATSEIKPYNVMPLYGLNVFSMLKHETLVITKAALESLEMKLLNLVNSEDVKQRKFEREAFLYNKVLKSAYIKTGDLK